MKKMIQVQKTVELLESSVGADKKADVFKALSEQVDGKSEKSVSVMVNEIPKETIEIPKAVKTVASQVVTSVLKADLSNPNQNIKDAIASVSESTTKVVTIVKEAVSKAKRSSGSSSSGGSSGSTATVTAAIDNAVTASSSAINSQTSDIASTGANTTADSGDSVLPTATNVVTTAGAKKGEIEYDSSVTTATLANNPNIINNYDVRYNQDDIIRLAFNIAVKINFGGLFYSGGAFTKDTHYEVYTAYDEVTKKLMNRYNGDTLHDKFYLKLKAKNKDDLDGITTATNKHTLKAGETLTLRSSYIENSPTLRANRKHRV